MKILLVDDDTFLLDMYATKFTEAGYAVETAKTVEDALKKLRDGAIYDVILLDMVMPGLTGTDLLAAVRDEKLGGAPVCVVLSNQGEQSDIEKASSLGSAGYIVKAETIPSEVVERVKGFLK